MPTTPDRPPADSADPEPTSGAARETVPVGKPGDDRLTEPIDRNHETRPLRSNPQNRPTVRVDDVYLGRRETVKLPRQRSAPEPPRGDRAPLLVAAGFATFWAALLSYLPVAAVIGLARTLEGSGGLGGAAHAGLAGWLLGHGVPIGTSIGSLGLAPLLLTALVLWRLTRAGLHVTRAIGARRRGSMRAALFAGGTIGLWYAAFGALAAITVNGHGTTVSATRAAIHFFLLGAAGAGYGALRSTDALTALANRLPRAVRHGVRTGVVTALLILTAGAVLTGLSVALGGRQAADMIAAYRTGVAGQAGITLLSLAYGANAVVWAAAYLLGPGFLLGSGSVVRITEVTIGPLPTLPLLAGLPNGPVGAAGAALLAIPVLVGMAAGALMTRRLQRPDQPDAAPPTGPPAWSLVLGAAAIAGPVAGALLGVLALVSGGPLGDGRMIETGPAPWPVALIATAVVAVSASVGAAAARAFRAAPPVKR